MSAKDKKFPVSFNFFLKCIHHEEVVEHILKRKANDDPEKIQKYLNSETIKRKALQKYYEAFYFKPQIRTQYPIKMKPLPKKVIQRLLQLPKPIEMDEIDEPHTSQTAPKRNAELCEEDQPQFKLLKCPLDCANEEVNPTIETLDCPLQSYSGDIHSLKDSDKEPPATFSPRILDTKLNKKSGLQILDVRVLPNLNDQLVLQLSQKNVCKFCQLSLEDFQYETNVLELVQADEVQRLQDIYIRFMNFDDEILNIKNLEINARAMIKLMKCTHVCTDCEHKWHSKQVAKDNQQPNILHTTEIPKDHTNALNKILYNDNWYNNFFSMVLERIQQPFDDSILPVSIETFKNYSLYLEPLRQILTNFCGSNVDLVDKLLNKKNFCDNLLLYYYRQYYTCPQIRNKYPLKLKMCPVSLRNKMLEFVTNEDPSEIPSSEKNLGKEKPAEKNSSSFEESDQEAKAKWMQRAKSLFSTPIDRTHTLDYILRTSFELKHQITHILFNLSLEEFKNVTHIYEKGQSFQDDTLLGHVYDHIRKTSIWPQNVFIKIKDVLSKLSQSKLLWDQNINERFLLKYISPKFLHWSNLMATTDFISCVCSDYFHRTADTLDVTNNMLLEETTQYYYNSCWTHEQWIGKIPELNMELATYIKEETIRMASNIAESTDFADNSQAISRESLKNTLPENSLSSNQGSTSRPPITASDTTTPLKSLHNNVLLDAHIIQPQSISAFATSQNLQEINESTQLTASLSNDHYITMPNTLDQISALLDETNQQNNFDPLEITNTESCNTGKMRAADVVVQAHPDNQSPRCTTGKIIICDENTIKAEPDPVSPLRNLNFIENSNGQFTCISFDEGIVNLDSSEELQLNNGVENVPSSQTLFDADKINSNPHKL